MRNCLVPFAFTERSDSCGLVLVCTDNRILHIRMEDKVMMWIVTVILMFLGFAVGFLVGYAYGQEDDMR